MKKQVARGGMEGGFVASEVEPAPLTLTAQKRKLIEDAVEGILENDLYDRTYFIDAVIDRLRDKL